MVLRFPWRGMVIAVKLTQDELIWTPNIQHSISNRGRTGANLDIGYSLLVIGYSVQNSLTWQLWDWTPYLYLNNLNTQYPVPHSGIPLCGKYPIFKVKKILLSLLLFLASIYRSWIKLQLVRRFPWSSMGKPGWRSNQYLWNGLADRNLDDCLLYSAFPSSVGYSLLDIGYSFFYP